jgi:Dyp-type peroxidase family
VTPDDGDLAIADMQGLVVSSFSNLPSAAYMLYELADPTLARAWLGALGPTITTAERKQDTLSINIAFTARGLGRLGLADDAIETFPHAFRDGMASERRARILGDDGASHPARWAWGGPATPIDLVLLLYAVDAPVLEAEVERRRAEAVQGGLRLIDVLAAERQPDSREHFGFNDGVGQPAIRGTAAELRQKALTGHVTPLEPGEVILGYRDEYGRPAPSPDVADGSDAESVLRPSAKAGRRDLGFDGSYLVFRQMAQDVAAFWTYVERAAAARTGQVDPVTPDRLAAKMVGRWPSGASLVGQPKDPHAGTPTVVRENEFEYASEDPFGLHVPIGSHIRRANPRDSLEPDPATSKRSVRRHRLMRRGRLYGDRIADRKVDDGKARGLYFICLNSDLERQFEFVQQTWINNRVFGGEFLETDPVVGNQAKTGGRMTIPDDPIRWRIHSIPEFATVVGGAYFFLPGIAAIRYLAKLRPTA